MNISWLFSSLWNQNMLAVQPYPCVHQWELSISILFFLVSQNANASVCVTHLHCVKPQSLSSELSCQRRSAETSRCRWRWLARVSWCHGSILDWGPSRPAHCRSPGGHRHTPNEPPCRSLWKPEHFMKIQRGTVGGKNLHEPYSDVYVLLQCTLQVWHNRCH